MSTLAYFDLARESDKEIFGALVFPHTGCRMTTMVGPDKASAHVLIAPGNGLCRQLRRCAKHHDCVRAIVRGDVYYGRPAPSVADFDESTLRWALGQSTEIAVWSSPYPDDSSALVDWLATQAGAAFHTMIETTPSRAPEWGQAAARWKKNDAVVRFFGPEGVQ